MDSPAHPLVLLGQAFSVNPITFKYVIQSEILVMKEKNAVSGVPFNIPDWPAIMGTRFVPHFLDFVRVENRNLAEHLVGDGFPANLMGGAAFYRLSLKVLFGNAAGTESLMSDA